MQLRRRIWLVLAMCVVVTLAGCTWEDIHSWFPGGVVIPPPPGEEEPDPGPGEDGGGSGEEVEPPESGEKYSITQGWIRADSSRFKTPYYVIDSGTSDPTLMIVGGMHGNEHGYRTAQRIVDEFYPDKGRIVVIPRANAPAVAANKRGVSDLPDLNRRFPQNGNPIGATANDIWDLVLEYSPDWFIDLHEGYDFHISNKNSVGQTVIYYPAGSAQSDATALLKYFNGMPAVKNGRTKRFVLLRGPVSGSLARKVGSNLGIPSAIIETTWKDPLERRIGFHTYAVKFIASRIGMTLLER